MKAAYVNEVLYCYFRPEGGTGEPLRIEPDFAHFVPEGACLDPGRVLYARFPADVTPERWANTWPTASQAHDYELHRYDGATVVRYERTYDGEGGQSFLVMPYVDPGMAVARAAREAYSSDAGAEFVDRPDLDLAELRRAAKSGEVDWLHPIPDAAGRKPPIWGVSVSRMCRAAGFDPRGDDSMAARRAMLEALMDRWDGRERDGASSGDLLPPAGGRSRARFFGLAWFPSDADEDDGSIDPPVPADEAVGSTFLEGGREWTVVWAWEPIDERRGWMYEVFSDDEFVAGLTQAGYERHVLGVSMGELVPWRRDGVTYGDVAGLVTVAFTEAHRRLHFEAVRGEHDPGERVQLFEAREGGDYVVEYECREVDGVPRYVPVSEMTYDGWRDYEPVQTILQSERDKLGEQAAAILEADESNDDVDDDGEKDDGDDGDGLGNMAAAALDVCETPDEDAPPEPSTLEREDDGDDDGEHVQQDILEAIEDL